MTMETSAAETGSDTGAAGVPNRNQNGQGDRFYGARNHGAGLYAEVRALRESRAPGPRESPG